MNGGLAGGAATACLLVCLSPSRVAGQEHLAADQGQTRASGYVFSLFAKDFAIVLPEHGWCRGRGLLENVSSAVGVDRVTIDGKPARSHATEMVDVGMTAEIEGAESFVYLVHHGELLNIEKAGQVTVFEVPIGKKMVPFRVIEISYRVRCAKGPPSPPYLSRGVRSDLVATARQGSKAVSWDEIGKADVPAPAGGSPPGRTLRR